MAIVRADSIRTLAFGGISGSYAVVGAALTHNWRMFRVTNNTDGDLFISFDGVTDNLFVPAGSFVLYDCGTNAPNVQVTDNFVLEKGTQFWVVESTSPSMGAVYVEGLYAKGE